MGKYNEKKAPVVPTEVNLMGEKAFKLSPQEELVSTVLTTFVQKSYYESENEVLKRITNAIGSCDPLFVAKLAIYTRTEANMRSASHVLAAELSNRVSGEEWARRFYEKIIVRPDDMAEIFGYYKNVMNSKVTKVKYPIALRTGFKHKLERLDAYLIDKYKMKNKEFSLKDIIKICHPVPNKKNEKAFECLIKNNGKGLGDLYSSKILEKEMSKAGKVKQGTVEEAKHDAISSVLENTAGMPMFNLLRNLRNILLYAPDKVNDAIGQLTTQEKIEKSRLLPFRFLSAYNEIATMSFDGKEDKKSSITFEDEIKGKQVNKTTFLENKKKVLDAIEVAIELSCVNIPVLEGRTAILIDHSGSVRGDGGGTSLVSMLSKTKTTDIANIFASMLIKHQPNVYVGLFGDKLIQYDVNRDDKIIETTRNIYKKGAVCGGGTENGIYIFFEDVVKNNVRVDNIIVFSDMVIGDGCSWYGTHGHRNREQGNFGNLFKEFRKKFPATKVISVDIKQTSGSSVFNKSYGVTQVAGWSDKIFDIISSSAVGYKAIIDEINKIVI